MFSNFKDEDCEGTLAVSFSGVCLSADAFAECQFKCFCDILLLLSSKMFMVLWTICVQQWLLQSDGGKVHEQHFYQE